MIRPIMKDEFFLAQKSVPAVNCEEDLQVARDLLETLEAHKEGCVGMAANMIGIPKRIIAFDNGEEAGERRFEDFVSAFDGTAQSDAVSGDFFDLFDIAELRDIEFLHRKRYVRLL